jgi:hypothetical protein
MSETAPEKPASGGGGGNVFTRKLGPLPMWMWMTIALLGAVLYHMYSKNKTSSTAATSTGTAAGTGGTAGTTDQSLVPQFVNQVYDNSSPTPSPSIPSTITIDNGGTSSTGGTINMPNIIGQSNTQAQSALKGAGLSGGSLSGPTIASGQQTVVAFQNPKAGAPVSPTTPITIGYETLSGSGASQTETQMVNGKAVTKKVSKTNPPGSPPATS